VAIAIYLIGLADSQNNSDVAQTKTLGTPKGPRVAAAADFADYSTKTIREGEAEYLEDLRNALHDYLD